MNEEEPARHTFSHVEGKGYTAGVWEVDVELIEDWLDEADPDTFDQVIRCDSPARRSRPGTWSTAGGLDRRVSTQEHEGIATRVCRSQ